MTSMLDGIAHGTLKLGFETMNNDPEIEKAIKDLHTLLRKKCPNAGVAAAVHVSSALAYSASCTNRNALGMVNAITHHMVDRVFDAAEDAPREPETKH